MAKSWRNNFNKLGKLGRGGNAQVYQVEEKNTLNKFALKELYNKSSEKKVRFNIEVEIARKYASSIPGIIPIIDSCKEEYWYTMPIAINIQEHIHGHTIEDIVKGVIQLSETLIKLHENEISHRDIKPSNIYFYENRYSFGDFGLVDFPDNSNGFTRSDRALGAMFTIAPEMKRDPKNSDGKKADVFSLAKTLWMLLSEKDRGFDGEYNFLDSSHGLQYIEEYQETHLVGIHELLKDATNNTPELRPTIKEFNKKLNHWLEIFYDEYKSQASEWDFLNKKIFGSIPPESSVWRAPNEIEDILNIIGATPAYNHMLFSDGGGLDFSYAELANEEECINVYDTFGNCYIVKPSGLYYEGFNEKSRWNYFLLTLSNLEPVFEVDESTDYEFLLEDKPANYVSAMYSQYGVYDYDTGEPLPEGYRIVYRYIKGKILIVMKNGPYNRISGTYDGRHGLTSNLGFRRYIERLIKWYSYIYTSIEQDGQLTTYSKPEIERRILNLDKFNENPFEFDKKSSYNLDEIRQKEIEKEKSREYIKNNYNNFCFKSILKSGRIFSSKAKFYFEFKAPDDSFSFDFLDKPIMCVTDSGYIKKVKSPLDANCYGVSDRNEAITLRRKFQERINELLQKKGFLPLGKDENCISIKLVKYGKPTYLFTKDDIKNQMQKADDRIDTQLVINEEGYARVIEAKGSGYLFPVSQELWNAGNVYVGKYSNLNSLNDDYIRSLQGWLSYLKNGRSQYMDYMQHDNNVKRLLDEIKKYY